MVLLALVGKLEIKSQTKNVWGEITGKNNYDFMTENIYVQGIYL